MPSITIVHPKVKLTSRLCLKLSGVGAFVSFQETYRDVRKFEDAFAGKLRRRDISADMERLLPETARSFSDNIAGLAPAYSASDFWWLSPYTEKNGWPSEYVLAETLLAWLKTCGSSEKFVLLTSNSFFGLRLKHALPGADIVVFGVKHYLVSVLVLYASSFARFFGFLGKILSKFYYARSFSLRQYMESHRLPEDLLLFRTYVGKRSFTSDGEYKDSHFPGFEEFLKENKVDFIYEPNLTEFTDPSTFFNWAKEHAKQKFLFWEVWADLSLVRKAIAVGFDHLLFYHKLGLDTILQSKSLYLHEVAMAYWKAALPLVLYRKGIHPGRVLFNWENKGYEKLLLIYFKKYFPRTKLIGYMNGLPSPVLPEMGSFNKECRITPYPDVLVCMGRYVYDALLANGLPKERLLIGPALRHQYLYRKPSGISNAHVSAKNILVCYPLSETISLELTDLVSRFAAAGTAACEIHLRPHPYYGTDGIRSLLLSAGLADKIAISSSRVEEDFSWATHIIYSGPTTMAGEACAEGKKLIRFVSKNQFSMDCLYYDKELEIPSFSTPEELTAILANERPLRQQALAEEKKRYYFQPIDSDGENLSVFLQGAASE